MTHTITIANPKGGVGKTTLAVNLAQELVLAKEGKVLLVDADPRKGVLKWFNRRELEQLPFDVTACDDANLYRILPPLVQQGGYQYTIVDCPAGSSAITRSAIMVADLVVVPVQPSLADFDFARDLMPVLSEVAAMKPVHMAVIITRAGTNSFSREARAVASDFFVTEGVQVSVFDTQFSQAIAVQKSYAMGKTLHEYSQSSKLVTEIHDLMKEIKECLVQTQVA